MSRTFGGQNKDNFFYVEDDGVVWGPGINKLFRYDSRLATSYDDALQVHIRKITIQPDSLIYGGFAKAKPQIKLPFKVANMTFYFAATNYTKDHSIVYSYFLEGNDKEWSEWTSETKKGYTNLWEGNYRFKVRAKSRYQEVIHAEDFEFEVLPPWYRTTWAYSIYLLIFGLSILIAFRVYTRQLRKKNIQLEQIIEKRTAEIRGKNFMLEEQKEEITLQAEELKTNNEQLQKLDRFRKDMTSMIVHDLKNPVNTIYHLTDKSDIKIASQQVMLLISNMLETHKLEEAKLQLNLENYLLIDLVMESAQLVQQLTARNNLSLLIEVSNQLEVHVDQHITKRILVNLLTNAMKYTPANGKIWMTTQAHGANSAFVEISVKDSGKGIPKDMLNRVFDKFSQVEAKKSGIAHSTGLGLTFSKLAVEAHGGTIWVESTEGQGATFTFTLPLTKGTPFDAFTETAITIKEDSLALTSEDLAYLQAFKSTFEQLEVYDISALRKVLTQINSISETTAQWKGQLENAIRSCNQERYDEIIQMIHL